MAALIIGAIRNPVQLIGVNVPFEPKVQFGCSFHAGDSAEKRNAHGSHDHAHLKRVDDNKHGINQPAPIRQQTIWRSALSAEMQRQLDFGFSGTQNSGRMQGNQFPQLDSVNTNPIQPDSDKRNYQIGMAPHLNGAMQLRLVKG